MSADESRPQIRRVRPVEKKVLPAGPARDLRDAIYLLYAEADRPQLEVLAQQIADEDDLLGAPKKDLISKIISGDGLASQLDTVTVGVALAQAAGRQEIASVADQVRRLWITAVVAPPAPPPSQLGQPIGACDPFMLEVHPAIHVSGEHRERLDQLPGYVPRAHDTQLRDAVVQMLADGSSRLVTVVGGSSTGKTRACWELARYLEQLRPGRWRLLHPYDPTRPNAALADLDQVGPNTIVWLNEAQAYLAPPDAGLGERIAARLRTLLHDQQRAPVLVLATLWPQYWNALTCRPAPGEPEPYPQARELLAGTRVSVADAFTPAELAELRGTDVDPRVQHAADHAEGGRISQYLAGAPELEDRYRTAPPAARAIIEVAIDARRLGFPPSLPHALLEHAASGYLDDQDWDNLGEGWMEDALAYTARACKGARGPLTRIRVRPVLSAAESGQACYRLADYLEQAGRHERAAMYPPESLWTTFAATVTDPDLLRVLGQQAQHQGRYQHAIWMYSQAADRGDGRSLRALAGLRERTGDAAGAEILYQLAAGRGVTIALWELARLREQAGDTAGAEALAVQADNRGDTTALRNLARLREQAGDTASALILSRLAADRSDTTTLWELIRLRQQAGDTVGASILNQLAADRSATTALSQLAWLREKAGDTAGAESLAVQAADCGDTTALRDLAGLREQAGDTTNAEILAVQAADRGDTRALWELALLREQAGDTFGALILSRQAASRSELPNLGSLHEQAGGSTDARHTGHFGLTTEGHVATTLNFGSYGGQR